MCLNRREIRRETRAYSDSANRLRLKKLPLSFRLNPYVRLQYRGREVWAHVKLLDENKSQACGGVCDANRQGEIVVDRPILIYAYAIIRTDKK